MASSWFFFFSYHNDARSNKHQIRIQRYTSWAFDRLNVPNTYRNLFISTDFSRLYWPMFNAKCATCFDRSVSIHQASANNEEKVYICHIPLNNFFFGGGQHPLVGQGLLIVEDSRSHPDTPHSVGLLWTSNQPDSKTST